MNEELIQQIVNEVIGNIKGCQNNSAEIPLETSARHVHLSEEHIEFLFGNQSELNVLKELSQPGQVQYDKRVTLLGPKGVIHNVAILGPARKNTQVEISYTDARVLGVNPPIRESGKLENTEGIIIATGKKALTLEEGVIVAKRHIHMTSKDAEVLQVKDGEYVKVRVKSQRPVILEDVLVRVSDKYRLSMHIDHDEGNATAYRPGTVGEIIK
ncbi:MAG: phosphate propanoyltransferase [Clostridiaceae bacterium]|nr:phosphate propanoyltransferase [Clostridiaceae bacterium]